MNVATLLSSFVLAVILCTQTVTSFTAPSTGSYYYPSGKTAVLLRNPAFPDKPPTNLILLRSSSSTDTQVQSEASEEEQPDYEVPEDAVMIVKPNAMRRLRELRDKQDDKKLVLRMGVRSGGCSGMSYVMDFSTEDEIQEDDEVDEYPGENIKCVVDAKSMLYLYGMTLDYNEDLIGGGFKVSKKPVAVDPVSRREILFIDYRCFRLFSSFSIPMRKSPVDVAAVLECNYYRRRTKSTPSPGCTGMDILFVG